MENPDQALTQAQKEVIVKWLSSKAPNMHCPACGSNRFSIADHLATPIIWSNGSFNIGGVSYPTFMIICDNCTNVQHFSAIASGVIAGNPPPAK